MKKKYVLVGGHITSKTDGQVHYVSAVTLARLYNLNHKDCIFINEDNKHRLIGLKEKDYTFLYPKQHLKKLSQLLED